MHRHQVGIIVLAAGASTRMGTPKQLIKIEGTSLIRRAVTAAVDSGARPVAVVLGANAALIKKELNGLNCLLAINSQWRAGMAASIQAGLSVLFKATAQLKGVLIMPADQPRVAAASLDKILDAPSRQDCKIVAAHFKGVTGTPAFFAREFFDELLSLSGAGGAKIIIDRHRELVLPVDLPEAEHDLDTPEDVAALCHEHAKKGSAPQVFKMPAGIAFSGLQQSVDNFCQGHSRRQFITNVTVAGVGIATAPPFMQSIYAAPPPVHPTPPPPPQSVSVNLRVNGTAHTLQLDPRVTLLDALRERLGLTGSKKGCDHGQCGACTVLVNGRRINSCLALAVVHDGDEITTIEGLATGSQLHPVQAAFLENDGFQCGYCTPGQICSAVALLKEGHANDAADIREWMSGNLCRCGAYTNIVAAILQAKSKTEGSP